MFSENRRFIAGAVCPRCKAVDRIVVFHREGRDHRECVACGFREIWSVEPVPVPVPAPPRTRPQRAMQQEQARPEPVRLIDPHKPSG